MRGGSFQIGKTDRVYQFVEAGGTVVEHRPCETNGGVVVEQSAWHSL